MRLVTTRNNNLSLQSIIVYGTRDASSTRVLLNVSSAKQSSTNGSDYAKKCLENRKFGNLDWSYTKRGIG